MLNSIYFRRRPLYRFPPRFGGDIFHHSTPHVIRSLWATAAAEQNHGQKPKPTGKWLTLPPFTSGIINGSAFGKELAAKRSESREGSVSVNVSAVKWIMRCCPQLPRSLVQKLFRLRQVRRETEMESGHSGDGAQESRLKRVAAKDAMNLGDRIYLPITVQEFPAEKPDCSCSEDELDFIRSLVVYKDPAIIVVNKPPGMPVQGGIGISKSLDDLAAACLKYDYSEPPRLVHRLDRDSSGILVMGRTQTSAAVLHSIFREKTLEAPDSELDDKKRILHKKYWALVIGCPRRPEGLISAPLGKLVVDNGKSERITVVDNDQITSFQHAVTEYRVIESLHGYSWLELSPLTGRKHQLRVHCAEVLGTPIIGDYKYGWQAHRKLKPLSDLEKHSNENNPTGKKLPFGLDLHKGSIFDKNPRLHLHCKRMTLPNISLALQTLESCSGCNLSEVKSLKLGAPLPLYMQRSWDALSS